MKNQKSWQEEFEGFKEYMALLNNPVLEIQSILGVCNLGIVNTLFFNYFGQDNTVYSANTKKAKLINGICFFFW